MSKTPTQLREDALRIWHAGLDAVRADTLVAAALRVEGDALWLGDDVFPFNEIGRILVVGAGKAGAGMVHGVEQVLGPELLAQFNVQGLVSVPEDCVRPTQRIRLVAGRPAGVNEPTAAGAAASEEMLANVGRLETNDLCLVLISGGGSALLPAPTPPITLDDKLAVTRHLSAAGAPIEDLNMVRKQLSRVKGGGLLRACNAGRMLTLIISDVLGDPLESIASGPTVIDPSTPADALAVLEKYAARQGGIRQEVFDFLRTKQSTPAQRLPLVTNAIIGNNASAVAAAGDEALKLGYSPAMISATESEGAAEDVGKRLAEMALRMRDQEGPDCLISGGEPVVKLVASDQRGRGGRNQQLAAATLELLGEAEGISLVSAGTDGEDGPTDAAGAIVDAEIVAQIEAAQLRPSEFLQRNDTYNLFAPVGGLLKTGPTHTNVCDLRVVVVDRS